MKRRSYLALAGIGALAGCIGGDGEEDTEPGGEDPPEATPLRDDPIEANAEDMLPTLDQFDDGWSDQDRGETSVVLANATEASSLEYVLEVEETIESGTELFEERYSGDSQEHELEPVDIGAQGYVFQPQRGEWTVVTRVANVVGVMRYDPGPSVDDPETNYPELAELFVDSINI